MSENFKDWLLSEIERRGWSYDTLAHKVGVSHSSVSQWVSGKYPPKAGQLKKIAKVMEMDEIELFRMVGYLSAPNGDGQREIPEHPLMREIIRALPGLDDVGLRLLWDHLRLVLKPRYGRSGVLRDGDENARRE